MIARQVGERRAGEDAAGGALLRQRVRGDFHRHHLRAGVEHAPQKFLQLVGLGRGVGGGQQAARPAALGLFGVSRAMCS